MSNLMRNFFVFGLVIFALFGGSVASAESVNKDIYMFGRENCHFCKAEKSFLEKENLDFAYLDVDVPENKELFDKVVNLYNLQKATPITLVGGSVIQGFNSDEITGKLILNTVNSSKEQLSLENYLATSTGVVVGQDAVCDNGEEICSVSLADDKEIKVPFFGVLKLKDFSLFSMSVILGFVDGFNPCAMWVLLIFLLALWQIGDKKKMLQVAGLFIFSEALMYWLILNFWFTTWDFVGLDSVITPIVGVLAVGGGIYFLKRYFKNRDSLTCDVASGDYKAKTERKIKDLINSPLTILTALGIIGVALSVNVIEFACSIGIPQTFTKVLEMNNLNLISEQFYILLYTLFYMVDDFVVFGLALYGFRKFYAVGQKYSNLSSLIGGVLLIILGSVLIFAPDFLIF